MREPSRMLQGLTQAQSLKPSGGLRMRGPAARRAFAFPQVLFCPTQMGRVAGCLSTFLGRMCCRVKEKQVAGLLLALHPSPACLQLS